MAKYAMEATETFETVIPAREIQMETLLTGEKVGNPIALPERRFATTKGQRYVARNKKDRDSMLKTGKWRLTNF